MTAKDPNEIRRLREASGWFVRLRAEPDSEESLIAWLQWCEQAPANADAFRRVQMLWRQFDHAYTNPSEIDALVRAHESRRRISGSSGKTMAALASWLVERGRVRWTFAVIAACAIGAAVFWGWNHGQNAYWLAASSGVEHRTVTLPDGSLMDLGARTTVTVDFRGGERRLELYPGEAFFAVRPDKKRPFVVHAGFLNVTAVGTAFDVKHEPGRVTVTVQEGIVAVEAGDSEHNLASDSGWRVARGYQLVYSEVNGVASLSSVDTSAVIAWREGRLEYVNTPLESVVADINRYSDRPIRLTDASVARLTFTGTVFTASIDAWLQTLPGALPVRVVRAPDGVSLVSSDTSR